MSFTELVTIQTRADGDFEVETRRRRTSDFQARVRLSEDCDSASSDVVTVLVSVRVTIHSSDALVEQGTFFTISGAVRPRHRGTTVILQRKRVKGWVNLSRERLNRRSRYEFLLAAGWEGERTFRVKWKGQDLDHEGNVSRILTLRSV